jgi:DNA-3-methyladenine glycosylase I
MSALGESFSDFLWAQVAFVPIDMHQRANAKLMVDHPVAKRICSAMKQKGFQMIGPKNISFFLQASGLFNAHWVNCKDYR